MPFDYAIIPYASNGSAVTTVIPFEKSPKYVKVRVTNQSGTYTITALNVWTQIQTG